MEQPSAIPRPSGIPRPASSRLPVLRSTGSQSQLRSPASTEQLRKKPSISSLSRPSQPPSSLQKKSSRASLIGSVSTTAPAPAPPSRRTSFAPSSRRVSGIPGVAPKAPASNEPVFKRPFARPPSRQTSKAPPPPAQWNAAKEDDALGSLDGFRSASRASSRAGSRAGFYENDPESEYVLVNEQEPELEVATKKKSRPSLELVPAALIASAVEGKAEVELLQCGQQHAAAAAPGFSNVEQWQQAHHKRRLLSVRTSNTEEVWDILQQALHDRSWKEEHQRQCRHADRHPEQNAIGCPSGVDCEKASVTCFESSECTKIRRVSSSSAALREQIVKAKATRKSEAADEPAAPSPKAASSSNALREQIAKAREAARRAKNETERTSTPPRDPILPDPNEIASFDFGLDDPFNQGAKGSKSLLRKRIDGARIDGRLNMAAMNLKEIPDDVLQMYKYDPNDTTVAWGEIVDLTTIVAADNELEALPESMFPDVDFETMLDSDDGGPQFGAVQNLDLHGNILRELPMGLTRLTQLSRLNLTRNKLSMDVFDVISNITSLRELRIAENELEGDLPANIGNLASLEILELQNNKLTSLPNEIRQLTSLRLLNVASNQLTRVPMELFETALMELIANKNPFEGSFFRVTSATSLQELNISNCSLKTLCDGDSIDLSALKTLNVSMNRLASLPSVESWTNLQALIVAENKLTAFPEGFTTLSQLRTADFTANDISQIDERIALMSLEHLTLAANPLRERKFLTMAFEDIKRDLASRLPADLAEADEDGTEFTAEGAVENVLGWEVTPSGTLDLSSKTLSSLDEDAVLAFADTIRHFNLQQNAFDSIPPSLSHITFLTVLDLSRNSIATALTSHLSLPKLKELRLAANKLTSLDPLIIFLAAPALQTLDVSNNNLLGTLPPLRSTYPQLISLIASDNRICEVPAPSLDGLKIVNLANNDIERLEPQIGLLQGSLTSLNVEGNKFRVPSWNVLQKGTEAVLGWLRDRIPRESWRSDGTVFFDA
ncbi:hypothetical protein SNOG_08183 [Parastagonospora nodorum SN15]|uniref:Leucine-rich repeat-containing protein 40 n=1 Tax=Phaeosphaeria nodorum (strain SN15 / ATCC MYA-4574 / FGSC 10173) TaxID=321614 RepID=Q0UJ81_PHANO|nr:hypothetical protein SNOG_08183 [Parastagonospora nodorum SN15]EAT84459.2 hypothetical protein SNOG_08183 [Parastagonospora nodorum SN15]